MAASIFSLNKHPGFLSKKKQVALVIILSLHKNQYNHVYLKVTKPGFSHLK
jgi:hypothetical protein